MVLGMELSSCLIGGIPCNLYFAAVFSILMYGVYRFIEFFPKLKLKAISFFENPKAQNLFILPIQKINLNGKTKNT